MTYTPWSPLQNLTPVALQLVRIARKLAPIGETLAPVRGIGPPIAAALRSIAPTLPACARVLFDGYLRLSRFYHLRVVPAREGCGRPLRTTARAPRR